MTLLHFTKIDTRGYREEGDPESLGPVAINPDAIRCVNPRRNNAPGTRLTFTDGGGFAIAEEYRSVVRYIESGEPPVIAQQRALPHLVSDSDSTSH